jgi:YD repeat-containing protein
MWYSIDEGDGSTTPLSFGFAPKINSPYYPGKVYHDDNTNYEVNSLSDILSFQIYITQDQYNTLQNFGLHPAGQGFDMQYNLASNNCINFVWSALATIGIQNPSHLPGSELFPTWNFPDVEQAMRQFSDNQLIANNSNSYDSNGNLISSVNTDANGNIISQATYQYNPDGSLASITTQDGTGQVTQIETMSKDQTSGTYLDDVKSFNPDDTLANETITQTSADGCNVTTTNLDGYNNVLSKDIFTTDTGGCRYGQSAFGQNGRCPDSSPSQGAPGCPAAS